MKKKYENPDMEIINLGMDDGATVVTASNLTVKDASTGNSAGWTNFF